MCIYQLCPIVRMAPASLSRESTHNAGLISNAITDLVSRQLHHSWSVTAAVHAVAYYVAGRTPLSW